MELGLINSAWAQAGRDTGYGIRLTKEIGFDSIDIFADPLDMDGAEVAAINDACKRVDLPIRSVACVALGLIDLNPSVRRFHVGRAVAYLDMARAFGARNLLLVLGEYVWQREVIPPAEQWSWAVEGLRTLGDEAAERGLEIALELEPFRESLLNDVPKMARFLDDVGLPSVKANVDISHLALSNQPPESLRTLAGRVAHVHISDCDGRVHGDLPPGRGVVDFPPYLRELSALGVSSDTVAVELEYSPDPDAIESWVREAYEATAALMRAESLRG